MVEGWDASNMGDDEWLEDGISGQFWGESFGQGGVERLHCTYPWKQMLDLQLQNVDRGQNVI